MTKTKTSTALSKLIDTNMVELEAVGWVERESADYQRGWQLRIWELERIGGLYF